MEVTYPSWIDRSMMQLKRIWKHSEGLQVAVAFIPQAKFELKNSSGRWNETHFTWNDTGRYRLKLWLIEHQDDNVYFSPGAFKKTRRNMVFNRVLYADLDRVANPENQIVSPSLVWQTSPGRYQCVWLTTPDYDTSVLERGGLNHRLSVAAGADPSGWDAGQMLRIPCSKHRKSSETHMGTMYGDADLMSIPPEAFADVPHLSDDQLRHVGMGPRRVRPTTMPLAECRTLPKVQPFLKELTDDHVQAIKDSGDDRSPFRFTLEERMLKASIKPSIIVKLIINSAWCDGVAPSTIMGEVGKKYDMIKAEREARAKMALAAVKAPRRQISMTSTEYAAFWDSRRVLSNIRQLAQHNLVSPWTLLGTCIARAIASINSDVVLPPLIGAHASLNFFVANVGSPSAGKSVITEAAEKVVADNFDKQNIGSGQGIAQQFLKREKHEDGYRLVPCGGRALFEVDEIGTMQGIASQQSNITLDTLRSGWSGKALGQRNADAEKSRYVPSHGYRFCLVAGVQPRVGGIILNDAAIMAGTPQRFLWMPGLEVELSADGSVIEAPMMDPLEIGMLNGQFKGSGMREISLPHQVVDYVYRERRRAITSALKEGADTMTPEDEALYGHDVLMREKVAVGLMLLDERVSMSNEDFELAGIVMKVSNETRDFVRRTLFDAEREASHMRGALKREEDDARKTSPLERCAEVVLRALVRNDGKLTMSQARQKVSYKYRDEWSSILDTLLSSNKVLVAKGARRGEILTLIE